MIYNKLGHERKPKNDSSKGNTIDTVEGETSETNFGKVERLRGAFLDFAETSSGRPSLSGD